jgi:hypothetical protein
MQNQGKGQKMPRINGFNLRDATPGSKRVLRHFFGHEFDHSLQILIHCHSVRCLQISPGLVSAAHVSPRRGTQRQKLGLIVLENGFLLLARSTRLADLKHLSLEVLDAIRRRIG